MRSFERDFNIIVAGPFKSQIHEVPGDTRWRYPDGMGSAVRWFHLVIWLALLGVLQTEQCVAQSPAPFPGQKSEWKGFPRYDFELASRMVTVVTPAKSSSGVPWLWRGEFFGAFATVDEALLKLGWHVVYMACPNTFGSPDTMQRWSQLYDELTRHHGFSARPVLLGMSRGGLYVCKRLANRLAFSAGR